MENNTPSAGGPISKLLQSLRNVLASLIDVGQTRLELLTLELQVEVRRAAGLLAIGFFTIFFAGMGSFADMGRPAGFDIVRHETGRRPGQAGTTGGEGAARKTVAFQPQTGKFHGRRRAVQFVHLPFM